MRKCSFPDPLWKLSYEHLFLHRVIPTLLDYFTLPLHFHTLCVLLLPVSPCNPVSYFCVPVSMVRLMGQDPLCLSVFGGAAGR